MKKYFIILLLFFAAVKLSAQPYGDYTIKWNEPMQKLYDHFVVYFDSTNKAVINDFISGKIPASAFRPYNYMDTNFVFDWYHPCWLKLTLHATFAIKDYRIAIPNINLDGASNGSGRLGAYIVKNGHLIHHYEVGNLEPVSKKIIHDPVNVNAFPLSLDSMETVDIYLCQYDLDFYWRNDAFYLMHPDMPLVYGDNTIRGIEVFFLGVMFILLAFGLTFFFITKQKPYIWFSLCALSHGLHTMLVMPENLFVKWIIPWNPYLELYFAITLIVTNIICFIQFARSFVHTKKLIPWVDKLMIANIVYGLIYLAAFYINFVEAYKLFTFWLWFIYITLPVLAAAGIRLLLIKDFSARCLGIAMLWLTAFQTMGVAGEINLWFLSHHLNVWVIAPVGYMIIIFFSLAFRYRKAQTEKAEAEKIKELDSIKSKFFANISHEFRTPLTLMIGPLKQMEQGKMDEADSKKYLKMMRHNGERLLNLINQMLDLSKLESGKLEMQVSKTDITGLLKATAYSFNSLAEQKQVNYHTHFPEHEIIGWIDRDKFQKIVTNLLSNAFKFTPENGSVSVDVENGDKRLRISVQDSGTGIPKEQLDKIFDRFYQVDGTEGGTGIGLSLVKELVQLHKGQISVSSDTGRGTRFRLSIPIARGFYTDDEIEITDKEQKNETIFLPSENIIEDNSLAVTNTLLSTILIVEDNKDLQIFISDILKYEFNIVIANNGKDGLQKSLSIIPDLIISDVMMPVMDGITMTNEIKHNEKTSHIPVIMLTAKAAAESKIEGLKIGADDYLIKPFEGNELIVRIQNLIAQRRKLRELFSQHVISITPSKVKVQSRENIFLDKIRTAIDENLDNELFGVVDLANTVNMGRSQLHRKLKALTGNGPNELIRNFRLERALELLQKNAGNITEVAFMTGFSSPAYFSKCFSERFGYTPQEAKKK